MGDGVTVLTTEQAALALGVSREYVRRIPGMRSGYPEEQVIARLVHLGRSREEAEAAIRNALEVRTTTTNGETQ